MSQNNCPPVSRRYQCHCHTYVTDLHCHMSVTSMSLPYLYRCPTHLITITLSQSCLHHCHTYHWNTYAYCHTFVSKTRLLLSYLLSLKHLYDRDTDITQITMSYLGHCHTHVKRPPACPCHLHTYFSIIPVILPYSSDCHSYVTDLYILDSPQSLCHNTTFVTVLSKSLYYLCRIYVIVIPVSQTFAVEPTSGKYLYCRPLLSYWWYGKTDFTVTGLLHNLCQTFTVKPVSQTFAISMSHTQPSWLINQLTSHAVWCDTVCDVALKTCVFLFCRRTGSSLFIHNAPAIWLW